MSPVSKYGMRWEDSGQWLVDNGHVFPKLTFSQPLITSSIFTEKRISESTMSHWKYTAVWLLGEACFSWLCTSCNYFSKQHTKMERPLFSSKGHQKTVMPSCVSTAVPYLHPCPSAIFASVPTGNAVRHEPNLLTATLNDLSVLSQHTAVKWAFKNQGKLRTRCILTGCM